MISDNIKLQEDEFNDFQWFGYFLGGMLPVTLFIIFELFLKQDIIIQANEKPFIFLCFIGYLIIFPIHYFHSKPKYKNWFSISSVIQALYSFFLIHIIVLYTGGPETSVFSLSYLYLIAIVGYTFGSAGNRLYGAAIILGISYMLNLFLFDFQQSLFCSVFEPGLVAFTITNDNKLIYACIFLIQGIVTTIIASKHKQKESGKER